MEQKWKPEDFIFAGQCVIPNPEGRYYNEVVKHRHLKGYVIDHSVATSDIKSVLTRMDNFMNSWKVRVRWENGDHRDVKVKDLLQVDEFKKVTRYRMMDDRIYIIDGIDNMSTIDRMVIHYGDKVRKVEVFDEEFRNKKIAEAYEELSNRQS